MLNEKYKQAVKILNRGGVIVLPTDTIYGIVGSALDKNVVEKIYKLRKRNLKKRLIVLIHSVNDLKKFGIDLGKDEKLIHSVLNKGGISAEIPWNNKKFDYLRRGFQESSFRIPSSKNKRGRNLKELLKKTGPLVAPSANFEGDQPAQTLTDAKNIFGDKVDFYIGEGRRLNGKPSTLVGFKDGEIVVFRGKLKI